MRSSWLCAALAGGVALLSLSACSDSSNVGLGVGPDSLSGGQPVTLDVEPDLDTAHTSPITGENVRQAPIRNTWRVLVGVVDDPLPGTGEIEAEGYLDVAGQSSLPSEILSANSADSLTAELRLTPSYLHGDSSNALAVEVYDLTEDATMDSARASATFDADETELASVDTAQISPTDSLVTIELRESWIAENLSTLQDTSDDGSAFEENFPGFKIVAPNSQAVVGFSPFDATLRLTHVSESDTTTADYSGVKSFTHIEQREAGAPPDDYTLLQDGAGVDLTMEWDFNAPPLDTLKNTPLNRAEVFVPVDTSALKDFSRVNFVRPLPKGYRIIAARGANTPGCRTAGFPVFSEPNETCILPLDPSAADPSAALSGALVPDDLRSVNAAFTIFEESFRRIRNGQSPLFTEYRVQVADRESIPGEPGSTIQLGLPSTLPVLVPVDGEELAPPRTTLTVTPL